jgi:hypothetical protein
MVLHRRTYAKVIAGKLVHHAAFASMMALNADVLWCNYCFPVLLMGEWSTLLLDVRAICRLLSRTEKLVSAAFAVVFCLTRILALGALLVHLWSQRPMLSKLLEPQLQFSYFVLLPFVYCLNWYWFCQIAEQVRCTLRGPRGGSKKAA